MNTLFIHKFLLLIRIAIIACILIEVVPSCSKFIEIDPPPTLRSGNQVFNSDEDAMSVMSGLYNTIADASISNFDITSLSLYPSLSADELTPYSISLQATSNYSLYYLNNVPASSNASYWDVFYQYMYLINNVIDGVSTSSKMSESAKRQLIGEARFLRAFFNFYLVNLYGKSSICESTDYEVNRLLKRSSSDSVYKFILSDLNAADTLLSDKYIGGKYLPISDRIVPNKYAVKAMAARVYLYLNNYASAEASATEVISKSTLYDIESIDRTFLKSSKEAIWQIQAVNIISNNSKEARFFIIPESGPSTFTNPVVLNDEFVKKFSNQDLRKIKWINSVVVNGISYYFPFKYKNIGYPSTTITEFSTPLRLSELFLVRSEARAFQNKIDLAMEDVNKIRKRAGLTDTSVSSLLEFKDLILQERMHELFCEYGHRWLDIKRTKSVDSIMTKESARKGGIWNSNLQLYPIPNNDILRNPNLAGDQNPGYSN